ncbi:FtsX-like permease family protein [Streptomyces barkulensis]|uniref:FtsX-like permease family protein n=1 Tax=Streptomyces barkulensis TaxID=1257026 RepID=UPI000C6E7A42|nr:FtsX-like permease family protein [Streptomyces barkulensis]
MLGLLVRRAWAYRSLTAAVLATTALTSCALTALAVFGDAAADAGLRRTLQHRFAARTLLEVEAAVGEDGRAPTDALVRHAARDAFDGLPVHVDASTRSGPYRLPVGEDARGGGDDPRLTLLATLDTSRTSLVTGALPGPAGGTGAVPVAVPEEAARALRLGPGDRMTLADRRHGPPLRIRVTGVYRPADRNAPYWRLDPMAGRGVRTAGFTTYGPLLAHPSGFTGGRVAPAVVAWQARADFSTVTADRAGRLRDAARRAEARLGADPAAAGARVATDLPAVLDEAERALSAHRSAVLTGAFELALLAGCVTVLVAGALHERRAGENALLRARGGSRKRIAALAAGEALLLTLPAAAVAALAAGPLAELAAGHGALAGAGVGVRAAADGLTWAVAAVVALGCAMALTAPALRRRGPFMSESAARLRRPALGAALRAGADLGILALAVVAYDRLSRYAADGTLSADGGAPGAALVIAVAPACCLLAGAVLTARLLPAAARATRWAVDRSRGLVAACAHWQVARRPERTAGPMLLGVLAVATAVLATGQAASWDRAQRDRADYAVGADLRVTAGSAPVFGHSGSYGEAAGIAAATPVLREQVLLPAGRSATVLAMDTTRAADVVRLREDLAARPVDRLLADLAPAPGREPGFLLPEGARTLRVTAVLRAGGDGRPTGTSGPRARLGAVLEDRYGIHHPFELGRLPADGEPRAFDLDLAAAAGPGGAPAGPLRLTRLTAGHALPDHPVPLRLTVTGLRTTGARGAADAPTAAAGTGWEARVRMEDPGFHHAPDRGRRAADTRAPAAGRNGNVLDVRYTSGAEPAPPSGGERGRATLSLDAEGPARRLPTAVATDAFLHAAGAGVGDTVSVDIAGTRLEVRVVGSVRGLPTTAMDGEDAGGGALLTDLRALEDALLGRAAEAPPPGEWWLAAEPGQAGRAAAALRARPDGTSVLVRDERARELAADPLAAGPRSALPAVALAAAVLAAAGLAVVTAGSLRERAGEAAVLRALGARRLRIAAAAAVEQGLLTAAAVGLGALVGVVLARLVVPLTVVAPTDALPGPAALVAFPGRLAPVLAAVAVAVPAAVSAVVAAHRGRPAAALRKTEV